MAPRIKINLAKRRNITQAVGDLRHVLQDPLLISSDLQAPKMTG